MKQVIKALQEILMALGMVGIFFTTSPVFALAFSVAWIILTPFGPDRGEPGHTMTIVLFGISFIVLVMWAVITLHMAATL